MKLRDLQNVASDTMRAYDGIKAQIEQIEKTVKERMPDAPAELTKAIADYKKQLDDTVGTVATIGEGGGIGGGPAKVTESLGGLFFGIQGVNAAPTAAQREYFAELQPEFQQKMAPVVKFLNESVPKINETLRKHNAPTIIPAKPVEAPR
jgi:hypothetical protein